MGMTDRSGQALLRWEWTAILVSHALEMTPVSTTRMAKLQAITVSERTAWRLGSALKLGRLITVKVGAKPARSAADGRRSRWRMKRACQAYSTKMRALSRCAGSAPA